MLIISKYYKIRKYNLTSTFYIFCNIIINNIFDIKIGIYYTQIYYKTFFKNIFNNYILAILVKKANFENFY